ncbi:MAG TPA: tetratricopeptide repeat protein [Candidatus Bathyarchaeia archaeon]|nr:tetratricopeptide repeat protein [Candidatus Bathyarchaeia archaeon]
MSSGNSPRVQSAAHPSPEFRAFVLSLLLFFVTLALYHQVRHFDFIEDYDDGAYVTQNFHIKYGLDWATVKWAFGSYYAGNWDPLTWLSHALDCRLYYLDAGRHHETSVMIHALSAVVLFWLLWRATGFLGRSFMVAALFALHPMNVESVAWIAERKNVLSMLFCLLALGAYGWYARRLRPQSATTKQPALGAADAARYSVVFLLYACALMSKAQIITFPFLLLLWDYWPLHRMYPGASERYTGTHDIDPAPARSLRWLVLEKVPLLAVSAGVAALTVKANVAGGAMSGARNSYPLALRLQNAAVSYPRYIGKLFWPAHLAVIYPYPKLSLAAARVSLSLLFLIAVTAFLFRIRMRARYPLVGWLWFIGTLVPMLGIVQVGSHPMADRFTYLPFIGLFIMICWGAADLCLLPSPSHANPRSAAWLPVLAGIVLAALATVTFRQIGTWKDSVTLWSHAVQVTHDNDDAEDKLGSILELKGSEQDAAAHFRAAAAINPSDPLINVHMGFVEQRQGDLHKAIAYYQNALELTQGDIVNTATLRFDALKNMGMAYRDLGDNSRAQQCFSAAAELEREYRK